MIDRRTLLASIACACAAPVLSASAQGIKFSRRWLEEEAQRRAQSAYQPAPLIPAAWRELSYEKFQHIWFNGKKAIWADEQRPMQLDLFTAGLYFPRAVRVHTVTDGAVQQLPYDLSLFATTDQFPDMPVDETMGYAGVRLRSELNRRGKFEEFIVFQGASYFRAIANKQNYGLSARGIALGTASAEGEEFPDFTDFWVEAAQPGQTTYRVHALLDGPSITGAYSFEVTPGQPTRVKVDAVVYPRRDLSHVGLGALTSMFLFDETNRSRFDDFRPAVHDSEGLLMVNGNGERIWRPLANPKKVEISAFQDRNPRGFGLMQRTRDIERYADLEARYENRPSLWITPNGEWGDGAVELVEIPADREIYDNIVAYWRPRESLGGGSAHRFSYAMAWGEEEVDAPDVARVLNTRIGKGFDQKKIVTAIDFAPHPAFSGELEDLEIVLRSPSAELSPGVLQRNPGTGGVRLAFSFLPGERKMVEMRAQLLVNGETASEVWLYRWTA
ncbi:MAG: glucan biosynthesis protein G [Ahrensia sp.]|nr:glucan biosynthesis protein G [Ahrensia sp.]